MLDGSTEKPQTKPEELALASESNPLKQVPQSLEHPSASPAVFLQVLPTLETVVHYAFSTRVRILTRAQLLLRCEKKWSDFQQRSAQWAGMLC